MGEVLTQVWLKFIKKWVSYLTKKWMHKKRVWKNFRGSRKLPAQAHEKVCDENERNKEIRKKRRARKNVIDGRKHYIGRLQKTGEKDWDKLRVNDYGHNEGTICLVNGWMCAKGMVFRAWAHERAPINSQWLVLRIGGADFLHCWVANSIWLERAGSLITKR